MKVAIITDTHFGARKGSDHLHNYFEMFYRDVFFPSLEKHQIDTVLHMGDIFDSRKAIDLNPNLAAAHSNLGVILVDLGK